MEKNTPELLNEAQKTAMVEQIKEHLGCRTHADFARKMGLSPQNAYAWIQRGTFNAELIKARYPEISGDWLLTGQGPMLVEDRIETVTVEIPAQCDPTPNADKSLELTKALDSLAAEQKLTAKAQSQADKIIEIMSTMAIAMRAAQKQSE